MSFTQSFTLLLVVDIGGKRHLLDSAVPKTVGAFFTLWVWSSDS